MVVMILILILINFDNIYINIENEYIFIKRNLDVFFDIGTRS